MRGKQAREIKINNKHKEIRRRRQSCRFLLCTRKKVTFPLSYSSGATEKASRISSDDPIPGQVTEIPQNSEFKVCYDPETGGPQPEFTLLYPVVVPPDIITCRARRVRLSWATMRSTAASSFGPISIAPIMAITSLLVPRPGIPFRR
jgi:hypothetical protein